MGRQVKIRVKGMQEETVGEEIVTVAEGTMIYKEPFYYVSYEERLDRESGKKSKTVLRFSETQLRVTRKGEVVSVLEFIEDSVHNSLYMTQMGNFEVELTTDRLEINLGDALMHLKADYRIGLNSMSPAQGKLEIYIEHIK